MIESTLNTFCLLWMLILFLEILFKISSIILKLATNVTALNFPYPFKHLPSIALTLIPVIQFSQIANDFSHRISSETRPWISLTSLIFPQLKKSTNTCFRRDADFLSTTKISLSRINQIFVTQHSIIHYEDQR